MTSEASVPSLQKDVADAATTSHQQKSNQKEYKWDIVWFNVVWYIVLHSAAAYGLFMLLTGLPQWKTSVWNVVLGFVIAQGITSGAHRLWSHNSYKAKVPFRLLLALFQTITTQNSIFVWARDHRVHHKYTDTDADPHNSKRGFFFSHIGWLMVRKQPEVLDKGRCVDVSDLKADPVVMFQHKYYIPLALFWGFFFPVWVPMYFWNECLTCAFFTSIARYAIQLNATWCVNSVAHMYGSKPYDASISAVQNQVLDLFGGAEGWHNYHHVFPWDYKMNEFGDTWGNHSAALIDFMASIGWAYDLKTTDADIIRRRCLRTGDGSRKFDDKQDITIDQWHRDGVVMKMMMAKGETIWGWDDKDLKEDDRQFVEIHNKIE